MKYSAKRDIYPITFYYPRKIPILHGGCDKNPSKFWDGVDCHVLQGYLRLREIGKPVEISSRPPNRGIVLCHVEHAKDIPQSEKIYMVAFLADRLRDSGIVDAWIVQNRKQTNRHSFFLEHWPQPGIVRRDASRENRVENVVYMGRIENLDQRLRGQWWGEELKKHGLKWRVEEKVWWDYSDVDVVVALRPVIHKRLWRRLLPFVQFRKIFKPGSKLINAWMAGVPAILNEEPAFRALRKSNLDYLEANNPKEALHWLIRIKEDDKFYRRLTKNCSLRRKEFRPEKIAEELWRIVSGPVTEGYRKKCLKA